MSFQSVMQTIGNDAKTGFQVFEHYLLPIESVVAAVDPKTAPAIAGLNVALDLLQRSVVLVEQKYAALGTSAKNGPAKSADVLALSQAAVQQLVPGLETEGVQSIINAIVALLNVPGLTPVAAAS